jgi:hypothetical protein
VGDAFVLLGIVGFAGSVFKTSVRTLYMRVAPHDALAGVFAMLEAQRTIGLAAGAVLVRFAVAASGPRGALLAAAGVLLVTVALAWGWIRTMDQHSSVPRVEIGLLRSIPIFAALPLTAIVGVASQLERHEIGPGVDVIVQGDIGDRYYVVASGELEYLRDGAVIGIARRGDGFGELALIHDAPRAATVRTLDDVVLYSLSKDDFLLVLTGYPAAKRAGDDVAAAYLGSEEAAPGVA